MSSGHSYGPTGQDSDEYRDTPSLYRSPSAGPKSFVSMSSHLDEDGVADGAYNIDHGQYRGQDDPPRYRSPYYPSNYDEPSPTSVQSTRHDGDDDDGNEDGTRPRKQKAFWRMSYVQNV